MGGDFTKPLQIEPAARGDADLQVGGPVPLDFGTEQGEIHLKGRMVHVHNRTTGDKTEVQWDEWKDSWGKWTAKHDAPLVFNDENNHTRATFSWVEMKKGKKTTADVTVRVERVVVHEGNLQSIVDFSRSCAEKLEGPQQ
jgi:hypothetical protein